MNENRFTYVGIYWNNHHHMLHAVKEVSGGVLWANLHLLFMCATAYTLLVRALVRNHEKNTTLAEAIGDDRKGKISIVLYLAGEALSWFAAWLGFLVYVGVAAMWLIPDRRIEEKVIEEIEEEEAQKE